MRKVDLREIAIVAAERLREDPNFYVNPAVIEDVLEFVVQIAAGGITDRGAQQDLLRRFGL